MMINKIGRVFKTKSGKTVVWQKPNLFLWGWIFFTILKRVLDDPAAQWAGYAATMSLVAWSLLEVITGVNIFRRLLGVAVITVVAYGILN